MKLGYNTWSMPTLSFSDAVRHCAGVGFDSVEITVSEGWQTDVLELAAASAGEWRALVDGLGIEITSLTANAPIIVSGAAWSAARERLLRSLALAGELHRGRRVPISLTASRPNGDETGLEPVTSAGRWEQERQLIVDRFSELAELASKFEARVALEPHVNTVVCTADRALEVLTLVANDSSLGLNLDISHFAVQGVSTKDAVAALGPHAIAAEVKDHTGVVPDFLFQIPGEGTFDYPEFLREMAAAGYDGSVSVEISVLRQRLAGYDPYLAASQSYQVLAKAFESAGITRPKLLATEGLEN